MPKKTEEEIQAEIKTLKELKPRVRRFSMFGEDNHRFLNIQIAVLENDLTEEAVMDYDSDDYSAAVEAIEWRNGLIQEDLSVEWKMLAK